MGEYFGTDGIRGRAEQFDTEFVQAVAKGLVDCEKPQSRGKMKVLIGGDTRESTEWIMRDFEKSFEALGIDYGNVGVLPTPAINYAFFAMDFDYAIDITASHNPSSDNGIKIFERGKEYGVKINEGSRKVIENALKNRQNYELVTTELREDLHQDALERYLEHLREYIGKVDFSHLRIGLDCANGAMSVIGSKLFEELGAKVYLINSDDRYGTMINHNSGSTHIDSLVDFVREKSLDLGAAFDGDGDRCLLVDETGKVVNGDQILAILTDFLNLPGLVTTVMANQGLVDWAKTTRTRIEITDVGDQNVAAAMQRSGIKLGGEQSGHIILPDEAMGDGMLTALMMTKAMVLSEKTLGGLANKIQIFPQVTLGVVANKLEKEWFRTSQAAKKIMKDYGNSLNSLNGRLLVRPSGTEDLLRITMWGSSAVEIKALAEELAEKIRELLDEKGVNE